MALFNRYAGGEQPTATKMNETGLPIVSSTADISAPYTDQVIMNSTDKRLYRYTGSAWSSMTSGPLCSVTNHAGQTIANNVPTYTTVAWDAELLDTDGMHDNVTNNDRLTIVKAGVYMVEAKADFVGNVTGQRALRITLNGNTVAGSTVVANNAASQGTAFPGPVHFLQLAVGDILRMQVWQNSGGNLNTSADGPLMSVAWLRD